MCFACWITKAKVVEKIQIHILCLIIFSENCAVYEIMWKKSRRGGQATDDNIIMAHVLCLLDN
jgi:hypothetical protein